MKNTNSKKNKDKIVKIITLILIIICLFKLIDMSIDYQQIKLSSDSDFVKNDPILGLQIESFYSRLKILPLGLILTIILRLFKKNSLALIAIILTLLMSI